MVTEGICDVLSLQKESKRMYQLLVKIPAWDVHQELVNVGSEGVITDMESILFYRSSWPDRHKQEVLAKKLEPHMDIKPNTLKHTSIIKTHNILSNLASVNLLRLGDNTRFPKLKSLSTGTLDGKVLLYSRNIFFTLVYLLRHLFSLALLKYL